ANINSIRVVVVKAVRLGGPLFYSLKNQLQPELHLPRLIRLRSYLSERTASKARVGRCELRGIRNIECFSAELNLHEFPHREVFHERNIRAVHPILAKLRDAPGRRADRVWSRSREGARVEPSINRRIIDAH